MINDVKTIKMAIISLKIGHIELDYTYVMDYFGLKYQALNIY